MTVWSTHSSTRWNDVVTFFDGGNKLAVILQEIEQLTNDQADAKLITAYKIKISKSVEVMDSMEESHKNTALVCSST